MALIYGDADETTGSLEDWTQSATQEILSKKLIDSGFHPSVIATCIKAKDIKAWRLLYREPLSSWHRFRLVIIGGTGIPSSKKGKVNSDR